MRKLFGILLVITCAFFSHTAFAQNSGHAHAEPQSLVDCSSIKPSFWGYHHNDCLENGKVRQGLHSRGIVKQLQDAEPKENKCCDGADSGECRVTEVNMLKKTVMVDGEEISLSGVTKIVIIEGLERDENAVVCATRKVREANREAEPRSYCLGLRGGG